MKTLLVALISCYAFLSPTVDCALPRQKGDPLTAVQGLVSRVLGQQYVTGFVYEVIDPTSDGRDVFELDVSSNNKPLLRGSSGVAMSSALNHYLKYLCNCSVTWGRDGTGDQLKLPSSLPLPKHIRVESPVLYRYYQNVCTVSYSMAWWDFTRWEREIDWMALNSYNLILSFTGQEYVWQKLYLSVGVTEDELKSFFSGPAFLAWQRMGNIRGWGGPLDDGWIANQAAMQKKIVERIRLFGMINVLPGFAGHVPAGLKRVYPYANFVQTHSWDEFNSTFTEDYLLEPTDELFQTLGVKYYQLLINEFGTDHVFNCDTFNEMDPNSSDQTYLAQVNKAIYNAMAAVDEDAVFLMQGWLFHFGFWNDVSRISAFLSEVPNDKMIILDMNSEQSPLWNKTSSYFGKPFIWCLLHNYDGARGIYGNLSAIAIEPVIARKAPGSTMIGTGITPEVIEQNPVVYDLMGEMAWATDPIDVKEWLEWYPSRRYGNYSPITQQVWSLLRQSAYSYQWSRSVKAVVERAPAFNMSVDRSFNATGLVDAWILLYNASKEVNPGNGPYQYDLVDIGRQCLVNLLVDLSDAFTVAYTNATLPGASNDTETMTAIASEMLTLMQNLDRYLGTNTNFLLGHWIAEARNTAPLDSSPDVADLLEFNARNQITMWGPRENIANDYASKSWSGLVSDYYYKRWQLFLNMAMLAVSEGKELNTTNYDQKRFDIESMFSNTISPYTTLPSGDVMEMTESLLETYVSPSLITKHYTLVFDSDIYMSNVYSWMTGPWTYNLNQVAYLCNTIPACKGFNSDGLLKSSTDTKVTVPGTVLYLKK